MLTEADKEYISNHSDKPVEELAEATKKSVKEITTFIKKGASSRNLKRMVPNKENGVAIMTPGVSKDADEIKTTNNPYDKPYIRKVTEE